MNQEQIIKYFNSNLLDLSRNIAKICPMSIIGNNLSIIEKILSDPTKKYVCLNVFIVKVLPYKDKIDQGDESFFLNKEYSSDLNNHQKYLNKVFEFKEIWGKLNDGNKKMVIQYMQLLSNLALNYYKLNK